MVLLFCIQLIFAQSPAAPAVIPTATNSQEEEELPPDPLADAPTVSTAVEQDQSVSLVKRLAEPFNYDRENKRDPFLLPEVKETPLLPGSYFGPFLPLQDIKLSEVIVKGIIMDAVKPKAIIQTSDSKSTKPTLIRLGVGDYLGQNFGVIQAIREGKVIVVQTLGEGDQRTTSTVVLTIRKANKQSKP